MTEQISAGSERQPGENPRAYLARMAMESAARQAAVLDEGISHRLDIAEAAEAQRDEHAAVLANLPPQNQGTLGPLWPGR